MKSSAQSLCVLRGSLVSFIIGPRTLRVTTVRDRGTGDFFFFLFGLEILNSPTTIYSQLYFVNVMRRSTVAHGYHYIRKHSLPETCVMYFTKIICFHSNNVEMFKSASVYFNNAYIFDVENCAFNIKTE